MIAVERTVRVGLMTYIDLDGASRYALEGATVRVHPDFVAAFDRLNVLAGDPAVAVVDAVDEPPRAGRGATTAAWIDYADRVGVTIPAGASRDDIIEAVDASRN